MIINGNVLLGNEVFLDNKHGRIVTKRILCGEPSFFVERRISARFLASFSDGR